MAGNKSFMTSLLDLLGDEPFMKNVVSNHYGTKQVKEVKDCLSLVEEILDPKGDQDQSNSLTSHLVGMPPLLSSTINELCCLITWEALHTNDVRRTMDSLFTKLSSFSWDAKALLTLSAFSVYYAENQHLIQCKKWDYKLGLVALLRGPRAGKFGFTALENLIKVTLEFTKCTVEYANYSKRLGELLPSIDLRANFYQIIFGVIGCSVPYSCMISASNELQEKELSTFLDCITKKYESFKKRVEDIKHKNEEQSLYKEIKDLFTFGTDIVELMAKVFCTENDLTVYQCSTKKAVEVMELKNKRVMLLISNLNLSKDDLGTLANIYQANIFKPKNYEIMWVPLVDAHNQETRKQFQDKRSKMQWYTCNFPVSKMATKFIRKKWKFSEQTQIVVLNQQGQVENLHAMSMIRLWGIEAFPFTVEKGNELWRSQVTNWFKLVVNNSVLQDVEPSIEKGKLIFLYYSAEESKTIKNINGYLTKIKQTPIFFEFVNMRIKSQQFLTRLESCMSLKMQESSDVYDSRTKELVKLYTIYRQHGGFALVARGSSVVVNTRLTDLEMVLSRHQEWINTITEARTFEIVFKEYCDDKSLCHHFYIPNMVGNIPDNIKCPDCDQYLKTAVTFECCHGAH